MSEDEFEVVEETVTEITEDGDIVTDDTVAVVDIDTGEAVIDEVVAMAGADGSGFVEETVTVVDADGEATVIADVIEEFEAD